MFFLKKKKKNLIYYKKDIDILLTIIGCYYKHIIEIIKQTFIVFVIATILKL